MELSQDEIRTAIRSLCCARNQAKACVQQFAEQLSREEFVRGTKIMSAEVDKITDLLQKLRGALCQ